MADSVLFVGPLDRVLFLRTLPVLDGLGPGHLAAVAQHARERFFPRGSFLLDSHKPAEAVYLIVEGEVSAQRRGERSQVLGAGETVGFLDLLARSEHGVQASALIDTLTLELDWDAQLDVCEEHFPVLMQYVQYLAQRTIAELGRWPQPTAIVAPEAVSVVALRALNLVDRILVLSRSRAFSGGSLDALAELAHHVTDMRFATRQAIWHTGDSADHFLLVVSGTLRSTLTDQRSFRSDPASTVGMHEGLRQEPRWYELRAESETRALRIDIEPFVDILEDHFDLAIDFTSTLAQHLLHLLGRETS